MKFTIYDLLRHLIDNSAWPSTGDIETREQIRAAKRLVDRLEEMSLLGQLAIDVKEEL